MITLNDLQGLTEGPGAQQGFPMGGPPQGFPSPMGPPQAFSPQPQGPGPMMGALDPFGAPPPTMVPPSQRQLNDMEQTAIAYLDAVNDLFESIATQVPALKPVIDQASSVLLGGVQMYMQTGGGAPSAPPQQGFPQPSMSQADIGPPPAFGGGLEGEGPENMPLPIF